MEFIVFIVVLVFLFTMSKKDVYVMPTRKKGYSSGLTERQLRYRLYLKSDHWKKTRYRALIRANFKCERCSSTNNLQVHHFTYNNLGSERDEDLIVLCRLCHAREHSKAA